MYSKIKSPFSNKFININSADGIKLLNNYINTLNGGAGKQRFSSYDCRLGKIGVDNQPISLNNCNEQYDPLGYDILDNYSSTQQKKLRKDRIVSDNGVISRCKLTKNGVCRKRQSASNKRGKRNIKKLQKNVRKQRIVNYMKEQAGIYEDDFEDFNEDLDNTTDSPLDDDDEFDYDDDEFEDYDESENDEPEDYDELEEIPEVPGLPQSYDELDEEYIDPSMDPRNQQIIVAPCQKIGDKYDLISCPNKDYNCLTPEGECSNSEGDLVFNNKSRCAEDFRYSEHCESSNSEYPCLSNGGLCATIDGEIEPIPDHLKYYLPEIVIPTLDISNQIVNDNNGDETIIAQVQPSEIVLAENNPDIWTGILNGIKSLSNSLKSGVTTVKDVVVKGANVSVKFLVDSTRLSIQSLKFIEALNHEIYTYQVDLRELSKKIIMFNKNCKIYFSRRGSSGALLKSEEIRLGFIPGFRSVYYEMNYDDAIALKIINRNGKQLIPFDSAAYNKYNYQFYFSHRDNQGKQRYVDKLSNINTIEKGALRFISESVFIINQENSKTFPNPIIIDNQIKNITRLIQDLKSSISDRIIMSAIDDGRQTPSSYIENLNRQIGINTILGLIQDFNVDRLDNIYKRSEKNFSQLMDYNITKTITTHERIQAIVDIFK